MVPPGAIVGVIGPNGAGKSTLFKMIEGREKPDSGEIKIGPTVRLAAVDQMRDSLPNDKTVFQLSQTARTFCKWASFPCKAALI